MINFESRSGEMIFGYALIKLFFYVEFERLRENICEWLKLNFGNIRQNMFRYEIRFVQWNNISCVFVENKVKSNVGKY